MKVVKQQPQQKGVDPRLQNKVVLGWNLAPESVILLGFIFIAVVIVAHFMGSMLKGQ